MRHFTTCILLLLAVGGYAAAFQRPVHSHARPQPSEPREPDNGDDDDGGDDGDEALTRQGELDWYNRRHPDGSARENAIQELRRLAPVAAQTSTQWTSIGPQPIQNGSYAYSGRVWGIGVDPRNSNVVYIATDGGGVWKTTDGGVHWAPLTDTQPNINMRDLALPAASPDTIYAATWGGGILKSTDAGSSWSILHTATSDYVTTISVHPTNSSIVLAAAYYVARSADGGATWTKVLPQYTTQVLFDPTNGNIAYAATTQNGLYRSTDGGVTWGLLGGQGLPSGPFSYITVTVAPSSPNILYFAAKTSTNTGLFFKSTDSGATWSAIGFPPNDSVPYWGWSLRVHPTNPSILYAGSLHLSRSVDGGTTWANYDNGVHVDHHAQVFSADTGKLYIGNDGGVWSTTSPTGPTASWTNLNNTLSTIMFYPGISINPSDVNKAFGGTQDNGTLQYQGTPAWKTVTCGDGGFTAIDFVNPQNVYTDCQNIYILASHDGGNTFLTAMNGINQTDTSVFIPPLIMDPSQSQTLYFGSYRLYQTTNGAALWTAISPDISNSQGIDTIAVAPSDSNTVYTGSYGPYAYVTRNALSGAPTWTRCSPSATPSSIAQITVDLQNPLIAWAATYGNPAGTVYKTTDGCATWTNMSANLPRISTSDIILDPDIPNTIYVGTDIGVYRSVDGGQSWLPLGTGLPYVIVHSLKLHRPSRTLRAGTYGRGMWDLPVPASGQVPVTITSTTPGAAFSLEDNTVFQAPVTFYWYTGAQHTITWLSTGPGARYVFTQWSDGSTANPRTITVPANAATYTATVSVQFLLTTIASPAGAGTFTFNPPSADGYYNAGTSVQINATAAAGYGFWYLSGDLSGGLPQSITMNAPHTVTANFYCAYSFPYLPYTSLGPASTTGFFKVQVGSTCSWNLSPNASWFTITSSTNGTGPAIVAYSVAANSGSSRSTTITISEDGGYTYSPTISQDAAGTGRPSIISMQPNTGTGLAQLFTYQFQDPTGYSKISYLYLNFETTPYTSPACDTFISVGNTSYLYLLNDAGNSYLGPVVIPSANILQNSQCTLDASKSSLSGSGAMLTATLAVTFKTGFSGNKSATASAYDSTSGLSSFGQMAGTWIIPNSTAPTVVSTVPASGSGSSQTFALTAADPYGAAVIGTISFLVNTGINGANACWILFNRAANTLQLANDGGTGFSAPVGVGSAASLSNSQCTLNAAMASVATAGNNVTVNVPLSFAFAFGGTKSTFLIAFDTGGLSSGWQAAGSWTVPASGPPAVLATLPAGGSGVFQKFAVTVADGGGAGAITIVSLLLNNGLNGANGCWLLFNRAANTLQLANDTATGFSAPITVGTAATVSNSQCAVNAGGASVTSSGTNLTVNVPISFAFSFAGVKSSFAIVYDPAQNSGWLGTGSWTVPASGAPAAVSMVPGAGTGLFQNFAVAVADGAGAGAITTVSILLNNGLNGASGCWLLFNRATNSLQLANDAATGFSAPITIGTAASTANSQCTVNAGGASVSSNGTNLTVIVPISFAFSFAGVKSSFVIVYDPAQNSGWQGTGTWTVPASGPPAVVSAVPGAGAGSFLNLAVTVADGSGPNAITNISILLNNGLSGANGCWVLFNRPANSLQLANDAATGFSAPITIGSTASMANSQCTVNAGGASVSSSGTGLTVNLPLSFAFSFAGAKSSFVIVYDATLNSGWQGTGTWTVPASGPPAIVSTVPGAGSGAFQKFAVTVADGGGTGAITNVSILLNNGLNGANGCWLLFNRAANTLQLANDAATSFSAPITIGAAASMANSQCTLNAGGASVSSNGTNLTVTVPLSFAFGFAGVKSSFVIAYDAAQNTGWQSTGSWTVPASGPPAVVSTVPPAGAASVQSFSVTVADGAGPTTINNASLLINTGISGSSACWVLYIRASNTLQLANDAGTGFSPPVAAGTASTLSNSQCTLSAASAFISATGNTLTINIPLSFSFAFNGTKNLYVLATDNASQNSGWVQTGSWTVPASGPPAVVATTPASGSGASQIFA
ncbi:MAG: hypothetical protein C5B51_14045, partial [Terriglobia bacterium]